MESLYGFTKISLDFRSELPLHHHAMSRKIIKLNAADELLLILVKKKDECHFWSHLPCVLFTLNVSSSLRIKIKQAGKQDTQIPDEYLWGFVRLIFWLAQLKA